MARPRAMLDTHGQAEAVAMRLKHEPAGWRRARLPAVKFGLEGELGLYAIAGHLGRKLAALKLPAHRAVHLWVADERRSGLQPVTRRVWSLRGPRAVAPVPPRYEWGYVFGARQVGGEGASEFLRAFWQDAPRVMNLIGDGWLRAQSQCFLRRHSTAKSGQMVLAPNPCL